VVAGVDLARLSERVRGQRRVVDRDRRRRSLRDVFHVHGEGRGAPLDVLVERRCGLARPLERRRLAGLLREVHHLLRRVVRLEELAHRRLRLGHLEPGGGHVHDLIGGRERLERRVEIAPVARRAAVGHVGARLVLVRRGRLGGQRRGREREAGEQRRREGEPGRMPARKCRHRSAENAERLFVRSHRPPWAWA
jgi:hypothetical protein